MFYANIIMLQLISFDCVSCNALSQFQIRVQGVKKSKEMKIEKLFEHYPHPEVEIAIEEQGRF